MMWPFRRRPEVKPFYRPTRNDVVGQVVAIDEYERRKRREAWLAWIDEDWEDVVEPERNLMRRIEERAFRQAEGFRPVVPVEDGPVSPILLVAGQRIMARYIERIEVTERGDRPCESDLEETHYGWDSAFPRDGWPAIYRHPADINLACSSARITITTISGQRYGFFCHRAYADAWVEALNAAWRRESSRMRASA